jgi:hypothetical protein
MNKTVFFAVLSLVVLSFFAFKSDNSRDNYNAAVNEIKGVPVFINCKPSKEYEIIGTVKTPKIVSSVSYEHMTDMMVDRLIDKYPNPEGILFKNGTLDECYAIDFK